MRPLTHLYLANLIIKEIENGGSLNLAPLEGEYRTGTLKEKKNASENTGSGASLLFPCRGGSYKLPEKVKDTILKNKEYFRAGAAGCDFFPDMLFGRLIIHPHDSGIWLEYLYEKMLALPAGEERDRAYAFVMGWITHYATDMFGYAYVNEYAQGWSSSFKDKNAERRRAVESYIDSKITDKIVPTAERSVKAPMELLVSCFGDADGVKKKINKIAGRKYVPPGGFKAEEPSDEKIKERSDACLKRYQDKNMTIYHLARLRGFLNNLIQYDAKNETPMIKAIQKAGKVKDLCEWIEDVDVVIRNWMHVWQLYLQDVLNGKEDLTGSLTKWVENSCVGTVLDLPEWFQKIAVSTETDLALFTDASLFKERNPNSGKELLKLITPDGGDGFDAEYKKFSKLDDEKTEEVFGKKFKDAEGLYKALDGDLKEFGKAPEYPYGKEGEFKTFSLCLTTSKLCLIGCDNLDRYLDRKKGTTKAASPKKGIRKIRLTFKFEPPDEEDIVKEFEEAGDESGKKTSGTYRQIFFDINTNDLKTARTVIGAEFARAEYVRFVVPLQKMTQKESIESFSVSGCVDSEPFTALSVTVEDTETGNKLGLAEDIFVNDGTGPMILPYDEDPKEKPKEDQEAYFEINVESSFKSSSESSLEKPEEDPEGGQKKGSGEKDENSEEGPKEKKDAKDNFDVPLETMSWIYSLDGADPTGKNPAEIMPWEYEQNPVFFYHFYTNNGVIRGAVDDWAKYFDVKNFMEIDYVPPTVKKKKMTIPEKLAKPKEGGGEEGKGKKGEGGKGEDQSKGKAKGQGESMGGKMEEAMEGGEKK